jgi:hypothetical protein
MDADRIEEPKRPRPAWALPIVGASALVVLACLAAWLGTRAFLHYRHQRQARELVAQLSPEMRDNLANRTRVLLLRELMVTPWPEADQELSRCAERSKLTAYVKGPGPKGFVYAYWQREPVPGDGERGEHISGVQQCHLGLLTVKDNAEERLEGIGAMKLRSRDGAVEVSFSLWDDVASALGVEKGRERTILLTIEEVGQLLRSVGAPWKESDFLNGYDLRAARFLLCKAGVLPAGQGEARTP